ncbi:hypothetical protein CF327_g5606 [Tilletia walkeri]|nr:hypothetical protein CF327_g5606 [Tilletia walkeri]
MSMEEEPITISIFAQEVAREISKATSRGDWWGVLGLAPFTTNQGDIDRNYTIRHVYIQGELNKIMTRNEQATNPTYEDSWGYNELEIALGELVRAKSEIDDLVRSAKGSRPTEGGDRAQHPNDQMTSQSNQSTRAAVVLLKSAVDLLQGHSSAPAASNGP